jgi:type III pantothenate kinase
VELAPPDAVLGRNTTDAIRSGVLYGYASLVDGLVARIESEVGTRHRVVVTGGLSHVFAPLLTRADEVEPYHTLKGLRAMHALNRG